MCECVYSCRFECPDQACRKTYDLTDAKAKDMILKTDKKRANYYNYYSNKKWSDVDSYDLCISSSDLGVDGAVEVIKSYIATKEALTKLLSYRRAI